MTSPNVPAASLNLPPEFSRQNAPVWKQILEQADRANQKRNADYIIGTVPGSPRKNRLILVSPDGSQWSVTVDNAGTLTATKL